MEIDKIITDIGPNPIEIIKGWTFLFLLLASLYFAINS